MDRYVHMCENVGLKTVNAEIGLWRTSPEWLGSRRRECKALFLLWPTFYLVPFNYRQRHRQQKSWAPKTFYLDNISLFSRCGGFGSRLWESLVYCKNLQTEERVERHISSKILQDFCPCHRGCGRLRLLPRATYSVTHRGCRRLRLQPRATYSLTYWGWGKGRLLLSSTYNPTLAAETGQSKNPGGGRGAKVWIYFSFFAFSSSKHTRVRFLDFDSVDLWNHWINLHADLIFNFNFLWGKSM